tara:strand:- start:9262 stop:9753 length:492 start_codon:yes stop_codon:yes gene_type:complete
MFRFIIKLGLLAGLAYGSHVYLMHELEASTVEYQEKGIKKEFIRLKEENNKLLYLNGSPSLRTRIVTTEFLGQDFYYNGDLIKIFDENNNKKVDEEDFAFVKVSDLSTIQKDNHSFLKCSKSLIKILTKETDEESPLTMMNKESNDVFSCRINETEGYAFFKL